MCFRISSVDTGLAHTHNRSAQIFVFLHEGLRSLAMFRLCFYYILNTVQYTLHIDYFSLRIVSETVDIKLSAVHCGTHYSMKRALITAHFGKYVSYTTLLNS